jgi:VWFA-related protein
LPVFALYWQRNFKVVVMDLPFLSLKRQITLAGLLCLCFFGVNAQQEDAAQKQRPRRAQKETAAPAPKDGPQEVDEDEVVYVKTQLVSVPAAVTDRNGRTLTALKRENFIVYEDGKPQQLANFATTDAPFEVALLLDTSGSTRADIKLIRDAARAFIGSLREGDRVALLAFSADEEDKARQAKIEVLQPLTDDRELLNKKLGEVAGGYGTPFYDALLRTVNEVFREPPAPESVGRRALVALTDGVDSASRSEFAPAREALAKSGIAGYFVQIDTEEYVEDRLTRDCRDDNALRLSNTQMQRFRKIYAKRADTEDFRDFCRLGTFARMEISRALYQIARQEMTDLARFSGGRVFPVQGLDEAENAFAQVAAEIGTQYSLGYYSSNKARDGKFRAIRVEIKGVPDAQVRAREGYVAPSN